MYFSLFVLFRFPLYMIVQKWRQVLFVPLGMRSFIDQNIIVRATAILQNIETAIDGYASCMCILVYSFS